MVIFEGMTIPCRHPYNPQWKLIWLLVAVTLAVCGLISVHRMSVGVGALFGGVPMMLALLLTVRRLAFPRFLELRQETMLLPSGLLRLRNTEIPYVGIEWTREARRYSTTTLSLRTTGRTHEIVSSFLPDTASYVAVRDFVNARVKAPTSPRRHQPGDPVDYFFHCSYSGFGEIGDSTGKVLWRVAGQAEKNRRRYPYGWLRLPDFMVCDTAGRELFRIKRIRRLPPARFVMTENGRPVCTIRQQRVLLNRYALAFDGGEMWTFHLPLFSVFFTGATPNGGQILVRLWSHNTWQVRISAGNDSPRLLAALAFIHRERLRCV